MHGERRFHRRIEDRSFYRTVRLGAADSDGLYGLRNLEGPGGAVEISQQNWQNKAT